MNSNFSDTLDTALRRMAGGETVATILVDYPARHDALEPLLETAAALQLLRPVALPALEALQSDRNEFLRSISTAQRQPVTLGLWPGLKTWFVHRLSRFANTYQRKEPRRMSTLLAKAALIITLLVGTVGGAAVVSADSLPGSPLYPLKQVMEQARLGLADNPADQAALHLVMAQNRVQEMMQLAVKGSAPGEATLTQLQLHLNQALQLAAQAPDETMNGLLIRTRQMVQAQTQALTQTQARVGESAQEPLGKAYQLLNQAGQEAEAGLQDPQTFRWRHAENRPAEAPPQPVVEPQPGGPNESPGNPDQPCSGAGCQPEGEQHRYGPMPDKPDIVRPAGNTEPLCANGKCEPVGDKHQYGLNSEEKRPGPGEPGGNPEPACDGDDCVPVGDEHHYGQEGDTPQPGPGEPGGNPDPTCDGVDCEPVGDQHQYGPQPNQPGSGEPGGSNTANETNPSQPANPNPNPEPISPPDNGDNGSGNSGSSDGNSSNNDSGGSSNDNSSSNNDSGGSSDNGGGGSSGDGGGNGGGKGN